MTRRYASAILTLVLLLSLVLTGVAQSTPDWPDWVFTGHWPPGEYTVWTAPSLFGPNQQYTITVPEGTPKRIHLVISIPCRAWMRPAPV
jgi:hypothetical protein